MAVKETGLEISLAAVLEVLGTDPDFRGRGVGPALMRQLRTNLLGLGVRWIRAEVSWDDMPGADCPGDTEPTCRLAGLFQEVDETVRATFASVTLATLAS